MARQRFVQGLCTGIVQLDKALLDFLNQLIAQTGTAREMQERRDSWQRYRDQRQAWARALALAWQGALAPAPAARSSAPAPLDLGLSLLGDDVVENKILASRMALPLMDAVGAVFDPLRQRTQQLEQQDLPSSDILRPETCCLLLVEQWVGNGLQRGDLHTVMEPLQRALGELLLAQYQVVAQLYDEQGVVLNTDFRSRVRRAADAGVPTGAMNGPGSAPAAPHSRPSHLGSEPGGLASQALVQAQSSGHFASGIGRPAGYAMSAPAGLPLGPTPVARARMRAQGVMAQLRRLLSQPVTGFDLVQAPPATQALTQALAAQRLQASAFYSGLDTLQPVLPQGPQVVVQLVGQAREQSSELKKKAASASEKAIIEVVALMFQSILTEDRIPSQVRVWFARLQVPVLRVALAEPDFFSNLDHPARRLIDRMGGCVMGFDASAIDGTALEAEVRRIVQVIEQYPETGQRVFQLVYDEFEKFLAKFLTARQSTARLVSVAQQVEQRETLAIQYTIELRSLLKDIPVRDEIRDFLFKTWAEVLALSAVRDGAQHADTLNYKRTATDLVWAASAKPNRSERAQVIQSLPGLLARLRQGLALIGIEGEAQDAQIKQLTDTLAEAFVAKTAAIPAAQIEAMAKRLANLEDFMDDATLGDMPLSGDNIEMMLGMDATGLVVIADTGAPVDEAMLAWAQQLPLGVWYQLDHNGSTAQVQYVWHSARQQLHLFAAAVDGSCYLIQLRRLAAYLQAGLLVPQDEEGLTVRATRDALAKIDANPERLLS